MDTNLSTTVVTMIIMADMMTLTAMGAEAVEVLALAVSADLEDRKYIQLKLKI